MAGVEKEKGSYIDFAGVFAGAKAGDPGALETFFERAKELAWRSVRGNFPDAEDVVQIAATKATVAVGKFEPPEDQGALNKTLTAWVRVIARNEQNNVLRRKGRFSVHNLTEEELSQFPDTHESAPAVSSKIDAVSLQEVLIEKAKAEVNLTNFPAVKLYLEGKSITQIAQELGETEGNVRIRLFRGRQVFTPFFESAGLKKASSFGKVVQSSVIHGRIDGVKILGMWYTMDGAVARYLSSRARRIDQEMLDQGYVLLSEHTSISEYVLLGRFPLDRSPTELRHGRLYIKPGDLAKWRETHKKAKPRRILPPQPGFLPLATFASTIKEYKRLKDAARSGELPTEKTGRYYFARPEDIDAFLASKKGIAPSGIIFQSGTPL